MKKFFSIMTVAALALSLVACEDENKEDNPNNGPDVPGVVADFDCLKGSDYYLFVMDAVTSESIKNKVVADLRTDDYNTHLWVWENTYLGGTSTGPNFFGEVEGWVALEVGTVGWSGAAFCTYNPAVLDKLPAITSAPADYVLHLAMKSQDAAVHELVMYPAGGGEAKVSIGVPGGESPYSFARDGEWHEIEIPMTAFTNNGLIWNSSQWAGATPGDNVTVIPVGGFNTLAFLSGGFGSVNLDACFIYKPAKK